MKGKPKGRTAKSNGQRPVSSAKADIPCSEYAQWVETYRGLAEKYLAQYELAYSRMIAAQIKLRECEGGSVGTIDDAARDTVQAAVSDDDVFGAVHS